MMTIFVELQSVDRAINFVNDISNMEGEFSIISSPCRIDAKSIIGILSVDLSKSIEVEIENVSSHNLEIIKNMKQDN